jgi:hypothetical protein
MLPNAFSAGMDTGKQLMHNAKLVQIQKLHTCQCIIYFSLEARTEHTYTVNCVSGRRMRRRRRGEGERRGEEAAAAVT